MVAVIAIGVSLSAGLVTGVLAMVAVAVRKEDRRYSLTSPAAGLAARGVRRLTGVGMRDITPSASWRQPAGRPGGPGPAPIVSWPS
jgi:hypothetical protein